MWSCDPRGGLQCPRRGLGLELVPLLGVEELLELLVGHVGEVVGVEHVVLRGKGPRRGRWENDSNPVG